MKGVVVAGGRGTRLAPFTRLIKKELLPVYDKPLIYYPLETLKESGVDDIVLISDPGNVQSFLDVIGEGEDLGIKIQYTIQNKQLGLAHALSHARPFIGKKEYIAVILGDNIFTEEFSEAIKKFKGGASVAVHEVHDPERFGIVSFGKDEKVIEVVEKPKDPKSNWALVGFYLFDETVFDKIERLEPSGRGEYELTDVLDMYLKEGKLDCIKMGSKWFDAGTFDSLLDAGIYFKNKEAGN